MPGLQIMLPLAVAIALGFLWLFLWSVRNGDYNDAEMTAHRILFDEQDDVDLQFHRSASDGAAQEAANATKETGPPVSGKPKAP